MIVLTYSGKKPDYSMVSVSDFVIEVNVRSSLINVVKNRFNGKTGLYKKDIVQFWIRCAREIEEEYWNFGVY